MKQTKKTILMMARTAVITLIATTFMVVLAGLMKAQNAHIPEDHYNEVAKYQWEAVKEMIPAYLQSIAIAVIAITCFVGLLSIKKFKMEENLNVFSLEMNFLGEYIGGFLMFVIIIAFLAQAVIIGLVNSYQWSVPGMSDDAFFFTSLGLAAFMGLCGRGIGITYVVLTAGIAGFMAGSFDVYVFLIIIMTGSAGIGFGINRFFHFVFFHKWEFEEKS